MSSPPLARFSALSVSMVIASITVAMSVSCNRGPKVQALASASASASSATPEVTVGKNSVAAPMVTDKPMLGIKGFVTIVFAEPRDTSKRLGYLRLGAKIPRSAEPVSTKGCEEGWYEVMPRGFVCAGKDATTDLDDPLLKAAGPGPNLAAAMPYRYGFVRAVLPLYLVVPSAAAQEKSEFKLKEHLEWYEENKADVDKVALGAWDVPLDDRGVPIPGRAIGELGEKKNSLEVGLGVHFGGESDDDPIPFWLEGGKRLVPNISGFDVPSSAVFADRARRFTGLSLIGSFKAGEESLNRRFAITADLRLAPATKLKPDAGSAFHGLEIKEADELPFAFVRSEGATHYGAEGSPGSELAHRSIVKLSGKQKRIAGERYLAKKDSGEWLRASDLGIVIAPSKWPKAAEEGAKWIEVSLSQQTLVLWEGKRPVYATLVSTGRKEFPTVIGEFRIKNKHITATMDSNESSDVGGGAQKVASRDNEGSERSKSSTSKAPPAKPEVKKPKKPSPATKPKKAPTKEAAPKADGAPAKIPTRGDGEYGVTKRRGEGTYKLRDVPYIQYFESGFALHAAYWHDVFGKQRSHGCVNLAPIDAHRVFMWTEPAVPAGFHAINTGEEFGEGTVVIVHE